MAESLFGWENEYGFRATDAKGKPIDSDRLLGRIQELAAAKFAHLPGPGYRGMFLSNGGRLYIDCGMHQEWCTPEVANPWDVVRYLLAGERMLVGLATQAAREDRNGAQAAFFRCNVDYSGNGTTWGAHESHLHRIDPKDLIAQIVPFLVSRLVITGAGGFDPLSPCRFTLSPRVAYLQHEVSPHSTHDRGIFHTKDESLCKSGYHRLHLLCGESLCSQQANWLKAGTTALVVTLADAGQRPGDAVALRSPLDAMRCFAADPTCTAKAVMKSGRDLSAVDIQRHYLELAEANLHKKFMPPWSAEVTRCWREMLDRLAGAPDSVATTLDWAIKLQLFRRHIQKNGLTWDSLGDWNDALSGLRPTVPAAMTTSQILLRGLRPVPDAEHPLSRSSLAPEQMKLLEPRIAERSLRPADLKAILQLRLQLLELDVRFGELGPLGIFNMLDEANALCHRMVGVDNIEHAMTNPPAIGRAHLRGEVIRRLSDQCDRYACDWGAIFDGMDHTSLDLSDPWVQDEHWHAQKCDAEGMDIPPNGGCRA